MEQKVIGILKSISELVVATLVEETKSTIVVKNPAFLAIGGQDGQININFIPLEMLSINPPINVRSLLANPAEDILYTFSKSSVLKYDLELAQNVVDNYKALAIRQQPQVQAPEENIVKLF
jgi:hypothetical protein